MKGSIEKRGERSYRIRVDLGRDASGKRLQKSVTVQGTRKEAEKKLAALVNEVHQGTYVNAATMTLSDYLDYWLEHYVGNLSIRTAENYREYVEYYIKPQLGQVRMDQLQPIHIDAFCLDLRKQERKKGGGTLSSTTVLHAFSVLRGALRQATRLQLIARNPADVVEPPPLAEYAQRILTEEQLARLLEAAQGSWLYLPIFLGLCTGMRRGEILGLRWEDVNMERMQLAIRQTLIQVASGRMEFKAPKTKTGRRVISLPILLVQTLQEEKTRQEEALRVLGSTYNAHGLVVCSDDGQPICPQTFYKSFKGLLERLGLPQMALHDLRHTHATHLLGEGINPKVVSERLGHSSIHLTLNTYSHVLEHMQKEAAERTDAIFRRVLGDTKA